LSLVFLTLCEHYTFDYGLSSSLEILIMTTGTLLHKICVTSNLEGSSRVKKNQKAIQII